MRLHGYWKSGAVIQQNQPYRITGWEPTADRVTAVLVRQSDGRELCRNESAVLDGSFSVEMPPVKGDFQLYRLEISGSSRCVLTDLC